MNAENQDFSPVFKISGCDIGVGSLAEIFVAHFCEVCSLPDEGKVKEKDGVL